MNAHADSRDGGRSRPSLRRQLALLLALAMAPAGALAVADGIAAWREAVDIAERDYMREAMLEAQAERDVLVGARAALEALALAPAIREARPGECDAALAALVVQRPGAIFAALTDASGVVLCASRAGAVGIDTSPGLDASDLLADPRFVVSTFKRGRLSGHQVVVASAPVFASERVAGVLHLSLEARFAGGDTASPLPAPAGTEGMKDEAVLVDMRGRPLVGSASLETLGWLPASGAWTARLRAEPSAFSRPGRDGVERVYVLFPILDGEVWLLGGAPRERVARGALAAAAPAVIGPALMWLAGVLVAYFTIDRLVARHVVYLSRLARAFGHGRLRLRPRGMRRAPAEIARLAADMSEMAANLDARQKAVAAAAETNRVLLLEVYHRVKNNLQMIASLLAMEGRRARTAEAREALERVRARVQSVALVHAMLYGGEDVSRVRLDRLTEQILRPLESARDRASGGDLALSMKLDPVLATAERATPFALFLTEAGANAAAHAHAPEGPTRIEVRLKAKERGAFLFTLANDAPPVDRQASPEDALGRRLMEGFAQQLGAELTVERQEGRHVVRLAAPSSRVF